MQHEERQENIANELLSLTRSLKQNMTVAGNVLKDDNKVILCYGTTPDDGPYATAQNGFAPPLPNVDSNSTSSSWSVAHLAQTKVTERKRSCHFR